MSDVISHVSAMAPALGAYGIEFGYGSAEGPALLRGLSLELEKGRIATLLGPNGCGKSTLLKLIAGVLPRSAGRFVGQVRQGHHDFLSLPASERAKRVAYVGQDLRAEFPLSALDAVMMGRLCHGGAVGSGSQRDRDKAQAAMERCHCWALRARDLQTLSGGERQLVALARALTQEARILLLDESLSRMDLNHQALTGKLLRQLAADGFTILLVAHDLNLASEWADECFLLREGAFVASGPTRDILVTEKIRQLYPGADLTVAANPVNGKPKVFFGV